MIKLCVKTNENVPQYSCYECSKCKSLFGKSLCSIQNRGCCFYFPKFNLVDIHRMSQTDDGMEVLKQILNNHNTKIYHYYIHAKGCFNKNEFNNFFNKQYSEEFLELCKKNDVQDLSIFFRACPFVKSNFGCTLNTRYRTPVCNFFICEEVKKDLNSPILLTYEQECKNYMVWYNWENTQLEYLLKDKKINLKNNFDACIKLLANTEFYEYEFPHIEPIEK